MKYKIIKIEVPIQNAPQEHVVIEREDGSFETFPVDESNPRYIQFLEENK